MRTAVHAAAPMEMGWEAKRKCDSDIAMRMHSFSLSCGLRSTCGGGLRPLAFCPSVGCIPAHGVFTTKSQVDTRDTLSVMPCMVQYGQDLGKMMLFCKC